MSSRDQTYGTVLSASSSLERIVLWDSLHMLSSTLTAECTQSM